MNMSQSHICKAKNKTLPANVNKTNTKFLKSNPSNCGIGVVLRLKFHAL